MPPSMSRLPGAPNGVSARAANAAAPAGSACTGLSSEETAHGRLATAITASVVASLWVRSGHDRAPHSATGTAARAVIDIAAKPPTAAGQIAAASRHGLI